MKTIAKPLSIFLAHPVWSGIGTLVAIFSLIGGCVKITRNSQDVSDVDAANGPELRFFDSNGKAVNSSSTVYCNQVWKYEGSGYQPIIPIEIENVGSEATGLLTFKFLVKEPLVSMNPSRSVDFSSEITIGHNDYSLEEHSTFRTIQSGVSRLLTLGFYMREDLPLSELEGRHQVRLEVMNDAEKIGAIEFFLEFRDLEIRNGDI